MRLLTTLAAAVASSDWQRLLDSEDALALLVHPSKRLSELLELIVRKVLRLSEATAGPGYEAGGSFGVRVIHE